MFGNFSPTSAWISSCRRQMPKVGFLGLMLRSKASLLLVAQPRRAVLARG